MAKCVTVPVTIRLKKEVVDQIDNDLAKTNFTSRSGYVQNAVWEYLKKRKIVDSDDGLIIKDSGINSNELPIDQKF